MKRAFIGEVIAFFFALMLLMAITAFGQTSDSVPPNINGPTKVTRRPLADLQPSIMAEFTPPPIYAKWWKEAMKCTGLVIPMEQTAKVHFYYVDAEAFTIWGDEDYPFLGYTFGWTDKIVLVLWHTETAALVKHEMTHYLMWRSGVGFGHPSKYFDKCHYQVRPL